MAQDKKALEEARLKELQATCKERLDNFQKQKTQLIENKKNFSTMSEQNFLDYQKEVRHLSNDLIRWRERLKKDMLEIIDPEGVGKTENEILEEYIKRSKNFVNDLQELDESIQDEEYNRKNALSKLFSKARVEKQDSEELTQALELDKNIKDLHQNFKQFYDKNKTLIKTGYFGQREREMNAGELNQIKEELRDFVRERNRIIDNIIQLAALRMRKDPKKIKENLFENDPDKDNLARVLHMSQDNQEKFPKNLWIKLGNINSIALDANHLNVKIKEKLEDVDKKLKALEEVTKRVKSAEQKTKEKIVREVEMNFQKKRDELYYRNVRNVSALAANRLLYSSLTPAEAEKLRRKRAFFDELRVQQAMCHELNINFDVGQNILSLSKMGLLKAKQFSSAAWEGAKEVISELSDQGLHAIDMTLAAPIAIPVKLANAGFTSVSRFFGVPGAYFFERPRDFFLEDIKGFDKLSAEEKAGKVIKWLVLGLITSPITAFGAISRGISKVSDFFQKGFNYDRWAKNSRGFTTAAGAVGWFLILALVVAAPFTLGFSLLIPLGALGIGLAVSSAYSVRRAIKNGAKAASEAASDVSNLELSEKDSIRLAMFDYDNPEIAAADIKRVQAAKRQVATDDRDLDRLDHKYKVDHVEYKDKVDYKDKADKLTGVASNFQDIKSDRERTVDIGGTTVSGALTEGQGQSFTLTSQKMAADQKEKGASLREQVASDTKEKAGSLRGLFASDTKEKAAGLKAQVDIKTKGDATQGEKAAAGVDQANTPIDPNKVKKDDRPTPNPKSKS